MYTPEEIHCISLADTKFRNSIYRPLNTACFIGGFYFLLSYTSLGRMTKDVEVDSDMVYEWHTMLHLQLYFQGHTGESSVSGITSLLHCNWL